MRICPKPKVKIVNRSCAQPLDQDKVQVQLPLGSIRKVHTYTLSSCLLLTTPPPFQVLPSRHAIHSSMHF